MAGARRTQLAIEAIAWLEVRPGFLAQGACDGKTQFEVAALHETTGSSRSVGPRGMNALSLAAIARDPQWLPHTYDREGSNLVVVKVTRKAHRQLPFLSSEELRKGFDYASAPVGPLTAAAATQQTRPLHFIFHTAFCCSTLLVNALASTGSVVGMKEPAVFQNLVHRLTRGESFGSSRRLDLVLRLLSRPFEGTSGTIAKPSCFANPLLPHILSAAPSSRAILLHSDVRTFLYAVAKRGRIGREWARGEYASCLEHMPIKIASGSALSGPTSNLEAAGLAWLMRRNQFNQIAGQFGRDRVIQLDGELLAGSADSFRPVFRFFELEGEVSDNLFDRHSKTGQAYSADSRSSERLQLETLYGDEVRPVSQRIERLAAELDVPLG